MKTSKFKLDPSPLKTDRVIAMELNILVSILLMELRERGINTEEVITKWRGKIATMTGKK